MMQKKDNNDHFLISALRRMLEIRPFESKVNELYLRGFVSGTIHLYSGQEAVAVGVCSNLKDDDVIFTTHRPHGHALAKGASRVEVFAEIMGRSGGCCRGRAGSMHIADIRRGLAPAIGIVAAGIPIAAGAAFAFKYRNLDNVAVSFFGDGATNEGAFHEGLNIASIWNLPVVYICENNLYGVSTRIASTTKIDRLSKRANSYAIDGVTIDGNDFTKVYKTAKSAIGKARSGGGPTLIECLTYRHWGHSRGDPARYRPAEELQSWLARDPIILLKDKMIARGILSEDQFKALEAEVLEEIDRDAEIALASPPPGPGEVTCNVYAGDLDD
ncbi:MAG: thiamine pyrophosphate-dependent dehydrogenase E1 component subunit alpha [Actinobacteria bacterium]|nr:thiamine pyrophosphate-dependent dehydrogenase E1 component subunit alpha [Actinomycetota bacterium]